MVPIHQVGLTTGTHDQLGHVLIEITFQLVAALASDLGSPPVDLPIAHRELGRMDLFDGHLAEGASR
jgi:hypothetical protein